MVLVFIPELFTIRELQAGDSDNFTAFCGE
jgi:hypothetical protein